jgi:hypothetical protein
MRTVVLVLVILIDITTRAITVTYVSWVASVIALAVVAAVCADFKQSVLFAAVLIKVSPI